jgi:hypothetical protein
MAWDEDPDWRTRAGNEEWRQDPEWRRRAENEEWRQGPEWRTGKDTGPVRKRFFGNPEIAQRFMGPARTLLGQLKADMAFNRLPQGLRRAVIPINQRVEIGPELSQEGNVDIARRFVQMLGTVVIVAYSSHGQSEVLIDARALTTAEVVAEVKVPKGGYVPYLFVGTDQFNLYIAEPNPPSAQALGADTVDVIANLGSIQSYGNGVNTAVTVGIDVDALVDITYFITANGLYGVPGIVNAASEIALYPASVQEQYAAITARTDVDPPVFFNAYVLEPAAQDLPYTPRVVPGWYQVRLDGLDGLNATTVHIVVDLGVAPRHTFTFEVNLAKGQSWDGALLIDVLNGVIARLEAQPVFFGDWRYEVPTTPDDLTGAEVFFHPASPQLPQSLIQID